MIKEITQIVQDSKHFTGVVLQESAGNLVAQLKVVEADEFVDDDFKEEIQLTTKIVEACEALGNVEVISQRRTLPADMSKREHYSNIIGEAEALADATLYKNTKRYSPNYLIMSSDLLPLFVFNTNFKSDCSPLTNGTYVAGSYKDIPALVSPILDRGEMIWGVNETNSSGIYTFINDDGKVCNKIVNPNMMTLIKLKD